MSLSDPQRMARLEWLTARLLLALGLVVIVGGFFAGVAFRAPVEPGANATQSGDLPTPSQLLPGQVFCGTAVAVAENFGIVPEGTRASGVAHKTNVQGRYVCQAETASAVYAVAVELECSNIRDQACFSLFAVKAADGTMLYQRQ